MARQLLLAALVCAASIASAARADEIIFESAALGQTGITWQEINSQSVLGVNVSPTVFNGVRFYLPAPVVATGVGGHFAAGPAANHSFFGAIVRLTGETDFPDSRDLSTPDVRGIAQLSFPIPSAEVFGDLNVELEAGWYAVVFGSGLFGTSGFGAAPLNNIDVGEPDYIGLQPLSSGAWGKLINPIFRNQRFVLRGNAIPEPSTLAIAATCLIGVSAIRGRMKTKNVLAALTLLASFLANAQASAMCASFPGLALNDARGEQIPLNTIWALKMPETRDVHQLLDRRYPYENTLVGKIGRALVLGTETRAKAGPCFFVAGTGKDALSGAAEVLSDGASAMNSLAAGEQVSLVFWSYAAPGYVNIDSVWRSAEHVTINYKVIIHQTSNATVHFALIPLGKLAPGKLTVHVVDVGDPTRFPEVKDLAICESCSISVRPSRP